MNYELKDSGKRVEYPSGAKRDTEDGKPRIDLISPRFLKRLGTLLAKGAVKYGENNWTKGMPRERAMSSALRHLVQAHNGETDEDHLAAVAFNVMAMIHFEDDSPAVDAKLVEAVRADISFWNGAPRNAPRVIDGCLNVLKEFKELDIRAAAKSLRVIDTLFGSSPSWVLPEYAEKLGVK